MYLFGGDKKVSRAVSVTVLKLCYVFWGVDLTSLQSAVRELVLCLLSVRIVKHSLDSVFLRFCFQAYFMMHSL